jgi:type II secretory pathway component GspD/PulD (secretin)
VSVAPDGRLVVSSNDVEALAIFEELAARLAPPTKDYTVFRLKSASATWIVLNLEEFFEDEDEADSRSNRIMSYMFGMSSSSSEGDGRRLSKRRPLRFISDIDTNTIIVQGADPEQLEIIKELIELYDVPEPVNSQKARVTKLVAIKYSKASAVANVIKDAYRDLLSTNDRALQDGRQGREQQRGGGGGMTFISPFGLGEEQPPDTRTSARFEGKLSIGVDDLSNTLLVSAEGDNLMSVISGMIEALDNAAKPVADVRVITLRKDTDGSRLTEALNRVLGHATPGAANGQSPTPSAPPHPGAMPSMGPGAPPGMEVLRGK